MIYFIQGQETGRIKIGYVERDTVLAAIHRMRLFQVGSPDRLTLRLVLPGVRDRERKLHGQFGADWSHGEWHFPSPKLVRLIAEGRRQAAIDLVRNLRTFQIKLTTDGHKVFASPRGAMLPNDRQLLLLLKSQVIVLLCQEQDQGLTCCKIIEPEYSIRQFMS